MMDELSRQSALEQLVQNGSFLADMFVMAARDKPDAKKARVAIWAALDHLERQGFIRFVPAEEWPEYVEAPPLSAASSTS